MCCKWCVLFIFVPLYVLLPFPRAFASKDLERTADVLQVLIPAYAVYSTYELDDSDGRVQLIKSFLATVAVTYGLKETVEKERPNGGEHSFPSGHTSISFAGASFLQRRYGWAKAMPSYLTASLVGWMSFETDRHYVEDVLAGAAIGIISNIFFTSPQKDLQLVPFAGNGYGLQLNMKW